MNFRKLFAYILPESFGSFGKMLAGLLLRIGAAALAGVLLLTIAFSLPVGKLEENMTRSAAVLRSEGDYPSAVPWAFSRLDSFTDAMILMNSGNEGEGTALERAMSVYRGCFDNSKEPDPNESIGRHYLDGETYLKQFAYPRYWHGYILLIRPLLAVTDYSGIRILNGICQTALAVCMIWLLIKKGKKNFILPYLLAVGMLMPLALAMSLQYSPCYYLLTFGSMAMVRWGEENYEKAYPLIFLYLGIGTAFFDFLTYPVAVFGVPAVWLLVMRREDGTEKNLADLFKAGLIWVMGYALMWASKWVLASLLTERNVVMDALGAVLNRTVGTEPETILHHSLFYVIRINITSFLKTPVFPAVIVYAAVLAVLRVRRKAHRQAFRANAALLLPYFLLALLPFAWHVFAASHSDIHFYFTNKITVVCVFAALCGLQSLSEQN